MKYCIVGDLWFMWWDCYIFWIEDFGKLFIFCLYYIKLIGEFNVFFLYFICIWCWNDWNLKGCVWFYFVVG